mmetsp:Transcript_81461/g.141451  ORF Transcript_81461/g.141451 Transcript_81461/m.141451 type:complete len:217 (+) Transcript_81461:53-703(+)
MAPCSTQIRALILAASLARTIQEQAIHNQHLVRSEHRDSASKDVRPIEVPPIPYLEAEIERVSGELEVHWMGEGALKDEGALIASNERARDVDARPHHHLQEPCGFIGCNSYTCAWNSGGAITKLVSGKTCSNAITLGSTQGLVKVDNATAMDLGVQSNYKIETLRDCMHAVKKQKAICSGHFQMNMDTWSCSCVPASGDCTEIEDHKVCRYKIKQ